jgi:hypothetical protein
VIRFRCPRPFNRIGDQHEPGGGIHRDGLELRIADHTERDQWIEE